MKNQNEQFGEVVIRDDDDVWSAVFNYEIEEVFGKVLDYFFRDHLEREATRERGGLSERIPSYMKNENKNTLEEFHRLCHALDRDQLRGIFYYFLNHFNEKMLMLFFEALDISQKQFFVEQVLNEICGENSDVQEKEIIRFRRDICHWTSDTPLNLKNALTEAQKNNFANVIQFFRKQPEQMRRFIGQLQHENHDRAKEILGGIVLELFSYLPKETEEIRLDDEESDEFERQKTWAA